MHDYSLGGPVDAGEYEGFLLEGKPLHAGNCTDGVYGCRACGNALKSLSDDELKKLVDQDGEPADVRTTDTCDWCNKEVSFRDISGLRPWDEPSCYYEVCSSCRKKHDDELAREYEHDHRDDEAWEDEYDYDWDDEY